MITLEQEGFRCTEVIGIYIHSFIVIFVLTKAFIVMRFIVHYTYFHLRTDVCVDVVALRDGALFVESNTTTFLSDVFCLGNEDNLLLCSHSGVGQHDCDSSETAGVICGGMLATPY